MLKDTKNFLHLMRFNVISIDCFKSLVNITKRQCCSSLW